MFESGFTKDFVGVVATCIPQSLRVRGRILTVFYKKVNFY